MPGRINWTVSSIAEITFWAQIHIFGETQAMFFDTVPQRTVAIAKDLSQLKDPVIDIVDDEFKYPNCLQF